MRSSVLKTTSSLPYVLILLLLLINFSHGNFYNYASAAHEGLQHGNVCFDYTDYTPTCGWMLTLTSDYEITNLEFWDFLGTQVDAYTYRLENNGNNENLETHAPSGCPAVNVYGNFGSTTPEVYVNWYCICDSTTAGDCRVVSEPTSTYQPTPIATTVLTTTDGLTTTDATVPTSVTTTPPSTPSVVTTSTSTGDDDTSMDFVKPSTYSECYLGANKFTVKARYVLRCAGACLTVPSCLGFNFRADDQACDLVWARTDDSTASLDAMAGCVYYRAVSR